MNLRWYDPVSNASSQFSAEDAEQFKSVALDALIEFRLASRMTLGTSYYFPPGWLESQLPNEHWHGVKADEWHDVMKAPQRGSVITDDNAPDDSSLIDDSYLSWWDMIERYHKAYHYHKEKNEHVAK